MYLAFAAALAVSVPFVGLAGDGNIVVAMDVGGARDVPVLLDTGDAAPFAIVLSPSLARQSGARATGADFATHAAIGATTVRFRGVRIASARLGAIRLRDPSAALAPAVDLVSRGAPTPYRAVIGGVLLRDHRVGIDYRTRRVTFDGPPPAAAPVAVVIAPRRIAPIVSVLVNGRGPFACVLDTGSTVTILSSAVARTAGIATTRRVTLSGAGGRAPGARATVRELRVGAATQRNSRVVIADVLAAASADVGMKLDGVLGASFFGAGRLTIDYPGRRAWIEP